MSRAALQLVLSCEHAGNRIPRAFRAAFAPPARVLASHRGFDPGSLELGRRLARAFDAPLFVNEVTRLLVDANRSASNPDRLSKWALAMPAALQERAAREVWAPHRDAVAAAVARALERGPVLHLSVHSFTPRLRGEVRDVDVGFLYDPRRALERELVGAWLKALGAEEPRLRLRRNAPYRGTDDGLTTALRQGFGADQYAGIELEVSQRFPRAASHARWRALQRAIMVSLARTTAD
ncbi:MAG: N-formylglutamate amidohydrolase [Planctomycetota bacterium]